MAARSRSNAPVLSERALNRALLDRQLLLAREKTSIVDVVEQVGGLQAQYAPSSYVGLWSRVEGFVRDDLTAALEDRSLVQGSLMRTTIHVVSRREYWLYVMGIKRARQEWAKRVRALPPERQLPDGVRRVRELLADGPKTVKELGDDARGFLGTLSFYVDLVRVPPTGTWERRRADRLALAEDWVGPNDATEAAGLEHLVRSYLRAFGPAAWADIASWAGISGLDARRGGETLALVWYRDEQGRELIDLGDAPVPNPDVGAPVRFLPHWDANLLVHARRSGVLPEPHRPRVFSTKTPFSIGTYLVDGRVAGGWSYGDGRIQLDPFERLAPADEAAVEKERAALEQFVR
ncbi:MAG TPA: winged helix DNA-binding domain-containing protein [Candidatus Limnocylindrales bacterium]